MDDEWLVGQDLLVAPVVENGARAREVSLPSGCWQREGAGVRLDGSQVVQVDADLDTLPWFLRCDTAPL